MSPPSRVTWTMVLPAGIGAEKPPRAKLQPMPNTRSDVTRRWAAARVIVCPPAPRVEQHARGGGDILGVAGGFVTASGAVVEGVRVDVRVADVVRQFEQHRRGLA